MRGIPGHSSIRSTLPLAEAAVPANPPGKIKLASAGAGVHGNGLANNESIGHEFTDGLA